MIQIQNYQQIYLKNIIAFQQKTASDAINSPFIDAVLIASSTPTHTKFIKMSAKAGKAIFCEKPIDLNIKKINDCWNNIKKFKVPIQIGFNRRYDPGHSIVKNL